MRRFRPAAIGFAIDLVDEGRAWFAELGNERIELEVDVAPRVSRRALAVSRSRRARPISWRRREAALAAQEEPIATEDAEATAFLVAGCRPAPDWSRRLLDAHDEGYAVVAGSVEVEGSRFRRGAARELEPWKPGFGRSPGWTLPLICPVDRLRGARRRTVRRARLRPAGARPVRARRAVALRRADPGRRGG